MSIKVNSPTLEKQKYIWQNDFSPATKLLICAIVTFSVDKKIPSISFLTRVCNFNSKGTTQYYVSLLKRIGYLIKDSSYDSSTGKLIETVYRINAEAK